MSTSMSPSMPLPVAGISSVTSRVLNGKLRRPWGPAVTCLQFVVTDVRTVSGQIGTGFAWTAEGDGEDIRSIVDAEFAHEVVGLPADPYEICDYASRLIARRRLGRLGTLSAAAVDLALWDLAGRVAGISVAALLGGGATSCPMYASGINLHYCDDEVAEQVTSWVAAGATTIKVKVGLPDLRADERRIRLVRSIIGPNRTLMIDANQRWTADQAVKAMDSFGSDVAWIEEPLAADDIEGHAWLAARIAAPIALGESLHHETDFARMMDAGACMVVQPNIARVGGITPFLRIALLAHERGVQLVPHLLPELAAPLLSALPAPTMVELPDGALFDDIGILRSPSPIRPDGDRVRIDARAGLGLDFRGGT